MKKLAVILIAIIAISLNAQIKSIDGFWGIPWHSTKQEVIQIMKQKNNVENIEVTTNFHKMPKLIIHINKFSGFDVSEMSIEFDDVGMQYVYIGFNYNDATNEYKKLKSMLVEKYGEPDKNDGESMAVGAINTEWKEMANDEYQSISLTLYKDKRMTLSYYFKSYKAKNDF